MRQGQQLISALVNANADRGLITVLVMIIVACSFVSGCVQPEQPAHEGPPAPQPPQAVEQPQEMPKLPPPKLDEVQEAVNRIFKDAAIIETGREPNFIAGDFNGDLSQDIAVAVIPVAGKLAEMNAEFPAWVLKDPFESDRPGAGTLRVERSDVLLAVIHGYGPNGWRDPEATQTYLLKNGAGSGMKTHPRKEFATANRGKKLPRLQGDLIGEVLQDKSGYLYYTGPSYAWYDPKTFKGEPERRLIHGGAAARASQ